MSFLRHNFGFGQRVESFYMNGKKVVVHRGGTIKKGRLINVTRCCVAGSDVSVARAANYLHQATDSSHDIA